MNSAQNPYERLGDNFATKFRRVLFTGPDGWLGREILQVLIGENFISEKIEFTFCGAQERNIDLFGKTFTQYKLEDLDNRSEFDLIIHCAFLTQDKMHEMVNQDFHEINRGITQKVAKIFKNGSPQLLAISSGAANPDILKNAKSPSMMAYGILKKEMEDVFFSISDNRTLISRVWNISGNQIKDPLKYALGDFISKARQGQPIILKSNGRQMRSFIPASVLFQNLLAELTANKSGLRDSGGVECSILELAIHTQELFGAGEDEVFSNNQGERQPDYVSPGSISQTSKTSGEFTELDLKAQILRTSEAAYFKADF